MTELLGANRRRITAAQALATIIGCFAAIGALLHFAYQWGAEELYQSRQGWQRMSDWLINPATPNWFGLGGIIFGTIFASLLMQMRFRFVWWPLHPIGYAIAANWTMNEMWLPRPFSLAGPVRC